MSFRYIGSKARVVKSIIENIGPPNGGVFIDAFSGTGVVALAAAKSGWPVHVNDHLYSSAIISFSRIMSSDRVKFSNFNSYIKAINILNNSKPINGFIWKEYSPASEKYCGIKRMYFTEENAQKIDGIRKIIAEWSNQKLIHEFEEKLLLADLIGAANRVANTAGTYGCFLSKWQRQSLDSLRLIPRNLPKNLPPVTMSTCDALDVKCTPKDTIYLDPPYTKRQYAAYYHILETIAVGDEPKVTGVCGIRPWQHLASDYCYKLRAAEALKHLVSRTPARRVFLSYSTEGHVSLPVLGDVLKKSGEIVQHELDEIGRYRPNRVASETGAKVSEVLFSISKPASKNMVAA